MDGGASPGRLPLCSPLIPAPVPASCLAERRTLSADRTPCRFWLNAERRQPTACQPLADTRRVSGLPRQFGIFRRIVGPAGAYFTRACEVCGLISSQARPSAFGGRASRRAALGGQPGPLPQRAGRRADSAAPGIGAEGSVPVAPRPDSQPTMPTTGCSARREDAIAPLAGRVP
jgi:hypothetical protein